MVSNSVPRQNHPERGVLSPEKIVHRVQFYLKAKFKRTLQSMSFSYFNNFVLLARSLAQTSKLPVSPSWRQLEAVEIAAVFLECDSSEITWVCAVSPAPFPNSLRWFKEVLEWREEQKLALVNLVEKYTSKHEKIRA